MSRGLGDVYKRQAVEFIETYLTTEFEGGRHERRIAKIPVKGRE